MRTKVSGIAAAAIKGEYIRLDALLKYMGAVETGGEAKEAIKRGEAFIDGEKCIQRGKKVYIGNFVRYKNVIWRIAAASAEK
jgi:ribosome-associated protein